MSDLALKSRAKTWEDIIGNEKTVKELQQRVIDKNFSKNTLLLGTTGTGKTTIQILLAKTLLCENVRPDGNPCNTCKTCKTVETEFPSANIFFYDGGNIGVDQTTKISHQASTKILGTTQKKVFIIDEFQNIKSKDAQDKMLKVLEREKDNAYFIISAMEWSKLKSALKDRCTTYYLYLDYKEIRECLVGIIKKENVEITRELADVVVSIVDNSEGSLRKAIGYLERVIYSNIRDTKELLKEVGIVTSQEVNNMIEGILAGDVNVLNTKPNEDILKQIIWKCMLAYKHISGYDLNRWEKGQLIGIKQHPMSNISFFLKELYELNKYSYVTPALIEFTFLQCINRFKKN